MNAFTYTPVTVQGQALEAYTPRAAFLAGGTNLIDEMKLGIRAPDRLVDINGVPMGEIEPLAHGGLRIGALVRNSDLAYHEAIRKRYRALSEAILSGASPQLRNMATTGGNLMQHTRCYYYRDLSYAQCNKRSPGSGCAALEGFNRIHAILGTSEKCIATHPSDMDVALVAFDAVVRTRGPGGERQIPIGEFYVPYGDDPAKETVLEPGELITAVDLPATKFFSRSHYLKVRDRASYEFALASAAVALEVKAGVIKQARVALGGVATKPWRATKVEQAIVNQKPSEQLFAAAASAEMQGSKPQKYNAFKVELAQRTIVQALQTVAAMA